MNGQDMKEEIESAVNAFITLGFPRYESLILSILTALGTSTVKEIHQHTDIPLPKVYQTLDVLTRKTLIKQQTKTRPVQYTAYSPEIIIRKVQEENRVAENNLKEELKRISELTEPSFVGDIAPFTSLEAFLRIGRGVISNTQKELSVAMSATTLKLFKEEFEEIRARGVKTRSMIFTQLSLLADSCKAEKYRELGFEHHTIDIPISTKPSLKFFNIIKQISNIIDYLGIMISDSGEAVVLLPLFPRETYFGIWICSEKIVERQLVAYNELFKISKQI